MNAPARQYMNALKELRMLRKKIENATFARTMTNNNTQKEAMNTRRTNLIRRTHPLIEKILELELQIAAPNRSRLSRIGRVVSVQQIARRGIQKRRRQNALRAASRRSFLTGLTHHGVPRSFLPPLRPMGTGTVRKMGGSVRRSMTALARQLMNNK